MINGVSRVSSRPGGTAGTLLALGLAIAAAVAGAVLWGLAALLIHRQLSLIGLLIGLGAGSAVARHRPSHWPTVAAGAVIAVAGCALGTFLAIVFTLLDAQVSLATIMSNLNVIVRGYPSAVGALGLLFWLIAAYAAVRVPLRSQRAIAPPPMTDTAPGARGEPGTEGSSPGGYGSAAGPLSDS